MFAAANDLHEEIGNAIPDIVVCLKDESEDVRQAAVKGLLNLRKHGVYHNPSSVVVLNNVCS